MKIDIKAAPSARRVYRGEIMIIRKLASGLCGILLLAAYFGPLTLAAAEGEAGYTPTVLITGSNRGLGFDFVMQ